MNASERWIAMIIIAILVVLIAQTVHIGVAILLLIFVIIPLYSYVDTKLENRRNHEKE